MAGIAVWSSKPETTGECETEKHEGKGVPSEWRENLFMEGDALTWLTCGECHTGMKDEFEGGADESG